MGNTILTTRQSQVLEFLTGEDYITRWCYLTGGTALSEFYLHHRLSEDLDFFSTSDINDLFIDKIVQRCATAVGATGYSKRSVSGLFIYFIEFDTERLKIDFNSFPYEPLETGITFHQLRIDSLYDIAVNKTYTIFGRFQTRDFIDLYFLLQQQTFSLEQLVERVKDKFGMTIDLLYLSNQLLRVIDLPKAYPRMLAPFEFDDMIEYFKKEAKRLAETYVLID